MMIVIAYDVSTEDAAGQKRLRKVANSVFECLVDAAQFRFLKAKLLEIIDPEKDSLRFYLLGNSYRSKIEHYGAKAGYQADGVLML